MSASHRVSKEKDPVAWQELYDTYLRLLPAIDEFLALKKRYPGPEPSFGSHGRYNAKKKVSITEDDLPDDEVPLIDNRIGPNFGRPMRTFSSVREAVDSLEVGETIHIQTVPAGPTYELPDEAEEAFGEDTRRMASRAPRRVRLLERDRMLPVNDDPFHRDR